MVDEYSIAPNSPAAPESRPQYRVAKRASPAFSAGDAAPLSSISVLKQRTLNTDPLVGLMRPQEVFELAWRHRPCKPETLNFIAVKNT